MRARSVCDGSGRRSASAAAVRRPGRWHAAPSAPGGGSGSAGLEPRSRTTSLFGGSSPPGRSAGSGGSRRGPRTWSSRSSRGRPPTGSRSSRPITIGGSGGAITPRKRSRASSAAGGSSPSSRSWRGRAEHAASAGSTGSAAGGTFVARSGPLARSADRSCSSTTSTRPARRSTPPPPRCAAAGRGASRSSRSHARSGLAETRSPDAMWLDAEAPSGSRRQRGETYRRTTDGTPVCPSAVRDGGLSRNQRGDTCHIE
jgi:hypothetical protein